MKRNSLRCIIAAFRQAIQDAHGIAAIPPSKRLYQFKITLLNVDPVIWRRIQIKDCSVDKLHACIQTAMGWTNSHLHQFELQGIVCGDPELLCEDGDCSVAIQRTLPDEPKLFALVHELKHHYCDRTASPHFYLVYLNLTVADNASVVPTA